MKNEGGAGDDEVDPTSGNCFLPAAFFPGLVPQFEFQTFKITTQNMSLAQQQRERSRQTLTREQLKAGVNICGDMCRWSSSWHERDTFAFSDSDRLYCDTCSRQILPNTMYSIGHREVYPDAPIPVAGRDVCHLRCEEFRYDLEHNGKTEEQCLADLLRREGAGMAKFAGWFKVPEEEKRKFLATAGVTVTEELLNCAPPLAGTLWVITGSFGGGSDAEKQLIERLGGKVTESIGKTTKLTHMLLGQSGTTMYGQPTGRGSKKYKEAMKKKATVVEAADFRAAVKKFEDEGVVPPFAPNAAGTAQTPAAPKSAAPTRSRGARPEATATSTATETPAVSTEPATPAPTATATPPADDTAAAAAAAPTTPAPEPAAPAPVAPAPAPASDASKEEDFESLPRVKLQALAKKHKIRANMASAAIIKELKRIRSSPPEEDDE
ncbi:hypothetical protein PAPYR_918 [Paratrimastix pyriformis]|uniref:BRCT domain-containing protein n=1 Tax=Paratrimastix pyriformis TaxID=342808 RepID=A0ABQ8UT53_9EUKA|nr:hypothetical protein PAPYR_918 [Paratrimastix pyriformis]